MWDLIDRLLIYSIELGLIGIVIFSFICYVKYKDFLYLFFAISSLTIGIFFTWTVVTVEMEEYEYRKKETKKEIIKLGTEADTLILSEEWNKRIYED